MRQAMKNNDDELIKRLCHDLEIEHKVALSFEEGKFVYDFLLSDDEKDILEELLLLVDTHNSADFCSSEAQAYVDGYNQRTKEIVDIIKQLSVEGE